MNATTHYCVCVDVFVGQYCESTQEVNTIMMTNVWSTYSSTYICTLQYVCMYVYVYRMAQNFDGGKF